MTPLIGKTIEQVLVASGCPWNLASFREYASYILSHRLQVASQPDANQDATLALILSSLSNVALPT